MPAPDRDSLLYTLGFAAAVCLVCGVVVASAAVVLRPAQQRNQRIDRVRNVLEVAGLIEPGEELDDAAVEARFGEHIKARIVDLRSGEYNDAADATKYDQRRAAKDPASSTKAPENEARVQRVPRHGLVYHLMRDGEIVSLILPIQGYGLWSTMYGYLALERDAQTVAGITFYEHGETPGLGGEIENPRWRARWKGRRAIADDGEVKLRVIKGQAGSPEEDPYQVDAIAGATITSRGVSNTLAFWLGPHAFGPYLEAYRKQHGQRSER